MGKLKLYTDFGIACIGVIGVVKVKTSIHVDKELWEKFKKYAMKRGIEVSNLLENVIRDEIIDEALESTLLEIAGFEDYEIDFQPIEPKEGVVSELIRAMRDERADSIP